MTVLCKYKLDYKDTHRQGNKLRVETMTPESRCSLKLPHHWPESAKQRGALSWIASGGDCLVFGVCDKECPEKK